MFVFGPQLLDCLPHNPQNRPQTSTYGIKYYGTVSEQLKYLYTTFCTDTRLMLVLGTFGTFIHKP